MTDRCRFALLSTLLVITPGLIRADDGFSPLFNGKNLNGWKRVNTAPSTWKVEDGMLVCSGKPIGELRTIRMYQNFILEVEWRHMKPKGNAGIFVWADDITAKGVPFHRSIEVQVLENAYGNTRSYTTHGDIFPIHGAKMTPINGRGGSRAFPTENRSKPSPEWNHYRIVCQDGEISLAVNGKVVTRGMDSSPRKGYICLESEGGIVHYRNLKIKELPETPIDDADVAIADRGYRCLYEGIDLSGWKTDATGKKHWKASDWILRWDGKADETADGTLATRESFGDVQFLFDVRPRAETGNLVVGIRTASKVEFVLGPDTPAFKNGMINVGQWNRFEGSVEGDRLSLSVNGKKLINSVKLPSVPPKGPIEITPDGPVDFANIYVK